MIRQGIDFIRKWTLPLISIVGTGIVGAVCLALMTAGKFEFVAPESAANLAIFIVFQTLGVTVVKAGLDSYVFARASSDLENAPYAMAPVFKKYVLPVWLLFALASYSILESPIVVCICVFSTLIDVYSAVRVAEFTARKSFNTVAIANLSKYPLYFILLFIAGRFVNINYYDLLYLYLFISLVRFAVVFAASRATVFSAIPNYNFGLLGVQQVFNYLLFRLDQVSIPAIRNMIPGLDPNGLSQFVFYLKFPELVSYCVTAFGSVFFPILVTRFGANSISWRGERLVGNAAIFLACAFGLLSYVTVFRSDGISLFVFVPLVFAAFLSFEVNFITFKLLAVGDFRRLLIGMGGAIVCGVALIGVAVLLQSVNFLYWIVPLQMLVYMTFVMRIGAE
ncbi:hypothetical protein [Aromatoleum diolicum]|uniref:Polysaccharide biosynthesis protein n=1 Tax=Aromatoleum diolicum TaxID=75796 RepID=A0ABX1Q9S4_9RHOO|nr:hypothetical protein [Aromatoleum diolicum]NMG73934.1 hypothetical protein [Aromatoleum diolicum]